MELIRNDINTFIEFMAIENQDQCLEMPDVTRLTDDEARDIIKGILNSRYCQIIQAFSSKERDVALHEIKEYGLSIRQIERITGVSRGVIYRA